MKKEIIRDLGTFEIVSGQVVVSDPGYTLKTWSQAVLKDVKKGIWKATAKYLDEDLFGIRVQQLSAMHEDINELNMTPEMIDCNLGVDSGQLGFFDKKYYQDNSLFEISSEFEKRHNAERWYGHCCDNYLKRGYGRNNPLWMR